MTNDKEENTSAQQDDPHTQEYEEQIQQTLRVAESSVQKLNVG